MKLTENEFAYYLQEASICTRDALTSFDTASNSFIRHPSEAFGIPKSTIFVQRLNDLAERIIAIRVKTYIDTCGKFGKYPDEDDIARFTADSKPYLTNQIERFKTFRTNPFGELMHESVGDAVQKVLGINLVNIFRKGIDPLLSFHIEGKVIEERNIMKMEQPTGASYAGIRLVDKLLTKDQKLWLTTMYEYENEGNPLSRRELAVKLGNKLTKGITNVEMPGAFVRQERITPLGIALLDPASAIVAEVNDTIKAIRTILVRNPKQSRVEAKEVSKENLSLTESQVEKVIMKLGEFKGVFHHNGIMGQYGWSSFEVTETAFDDFMRYESLDDILENLVVKPSDETSRTDIAGKEFSGSSVHYHGDFVAGNQVKARDVGSGSQLIQSASDVNSIKTISTNAKEKPRKWYENSMLLFAIIAALIAIVGIFTAIYNPELRTWLGLPIQSR